MDLWILGTETWELDILIDLYSIYRKIIIIIPLLLLLIEISKERKLIRLEEHLNSQPDSGHVSKGRGVILLSTRHVSEIKRTEEQKEGRLAGRRIAAAV